MLPTASRRYIYSQQIAAFNDSVEKKNNKSWSKFPIYKDKLVTTQKPLEEIK